jgi:membrane-associated phospholipid phosphatase
MPKGNFMPYSLLILLLLSPNAPGQNSVAEQPSAPEKAQKSAINVQPGGEVIKPKDLWTETGYFHPFVRMPKYILQDQKAIWTSPFHTAKSDIKFWAIFGVATAGLIATDRHITQQLPNSPTQVSVSTWGSRFGASYTLIPVSAGFYFIGTDEHNDRLRETGLLSFESLIDSTLVVEAVKLAADRARPYETNGSGHFESSPSGRWSSGFPSGHAINVWTVASVVAHEYPHPRYIPIIAYGLATTVVVARVGARQHFPGDVLAGSAMGWFIGDFTYARRHNPALDQKPSAAQKVLDHVHFNFAIE